MSDVVFEICLQHCLVFSTRILIAERNLLEEMSVYNIFLVNCFDYLKIEIKAGFYV